jgi:hypothetical protein
MKKPHVLAVLIATVLPLSAGSALCEETYQKYRFSLTVNNYSSTDELRTNADNTALFKNGAGGYTAVDDPRPDSGVRNTDSVRDDARYDFQFSYGVLKWRWAELTLDTGVSYFKGRLGGLEVAAQYDLVDPPRTQLGERERYHISYISIGDVKEIPVQVGATVRFRPKKTFNPYVGAGVGYLFADIEPTAEFLQFSKNVAKSTGTPTIAIGNGASRSGTPHRLKAAQVVTPDTFEYHLSGGVELTLTKGLSAIVSGAWMWAEKKIEITIDGKQNFGQAVPNGITKILYPSSGMPVGIGYGQGGLIDFGSGFPYDDPATGKHYVGPKDGLVDSGSYYAQGGELRYGGFEFGLGLRYQF